MASPNQQPAPGQRLPLSKERVSSTIPGQAESGTWQYPSPQMFYNAMRRKGYEPKEEDMRTVVAIHNSVRALLARSSAWPRAQRALSPPRR